jgi:DNA-binding beta-propeller fold protein YncE
VNPQTDTVYVVNGGQTSNNVPEAHGDNLSVIDAATCLPSKTSGCAPLATVRVGASPADLAIDQVTDTLYVTNTYDNTSKVFGTVSVVNGATCNANNRSGCAQRAPQVVTQADPDEQTFDPVSRPVYVTNQRSDSLSVIRTATCNAQNLRGCTPTSATAIPTGTQPDAIVADSTTGTLYVLDSGDNAVAVLRA